MMSQIWWYSARAAGMVAWALLAGATAVGARVVEPDAVAALPRQLDPRPASLPRRVGGRVHRRARGVDHRRLVRAVRPHRRAGSVRIVVASGLGRVGCGVALPAARGGAHVAGPPATPRQGLAPHPHVGLPAVRDGHDALRDRRHRRRVAPCVGCDHHHHPRHRCPHDPAGAHRGDAPVSDEPVLDEPLRRGERGVAAE